LDICQNVYDPNNINIAYALNNLGALYHNQQKYKQAQDFYNQALAICKKNSNDRHPFGAVVLNNIAAIKKEEKDFSSARQFCLEALVIRQKTRRWLSR